MEKPVSLELKHNEVELIVGNSNSNFSGVTSTMLQVLPYQEKLMKLKVLGNKHHLSDSSLYISFWQAIKIARQPLSNGRIRIFHARRVDEMIQALLLKYLFGAKFKVVFSSAAQRKRSKFTLWLTRRMDAVIAMCKTSATYLEIPPSTIIYHGINIDTFSPAKDKLQTWQAIEFPGKPLNVNKYGIAILGRVRKQKGVHLFVDACIEVFKNNPYYTAIIVGLVTSSHKGFVADLSEKIAKAGLTDRIVFTGEQNFKDIPNIFSSLSLVAALSENEGFGLTALEAMSSGAAVLTTDAGAWPEVIRNEVDGYVVPVNDLQAVTDRLEHLLVDSERLVQMGINGRKNIEDNFTVEREAKELCLFFNSLQ
ncbi:MAG: glycosyltransferase family 4 protein [Colwellia sp.]|nr:glycosyltransferase family 4 protein [Colwellia sp.]